jgi:3-deoxy-D-manno-octulosonic-acid transferase
MPTPSLSYRVALAGASLLAPRESGLTAWGRDLRQPGRPLVLVHAASAGELRQAEPIIRRLRARHPDWQLAATYFSRSALHVAESLPLDAHGLAPWDTPAAVSALLDAVRPSAIIIAKHDLWPQLAAEASRRETPIALIAATVRSGSSRLRWPARRLLAPAYASLARIGAVSPADADRLTLLGARPQCIEVLGDPRYDGVIERIAGLPRPVPHPGAIIAGSTWSADEDVLLGALRQVRRERPEVRLVIVPHEPQPSALRRLHTAARRLGLPAPVPMAHATERDQLVVVDRVGGLAETYALGTIAYVGGGFGRAGLHSVLEPAAWGVPVIVGPRSLDSADAVRLHAAKGLHRLPPQGSAAVLEAWWLEWLADPEWCREAGVAARAAVEAGAGAADRCTALVESLL